MHDLVLVVIGAVIGFMLNIVVMVWPEDDEDED